MRQRSLPPRPGINPHADQVAARLRALADPVRLRLLGVLARGDCPVTVLAAATGIGQSLVSFHLAALREVGLITTQRVGRFAYAHLEAHAIPELFDEVTDLIVGEQPLLAGQAGLVRTVVFATRHDATVGPIAAAWFNQLAPAGLRAISAGTRPADHLDPAVVDTMTEAGIDLGDGRPQLLTPDLLASAELLVTIAAGDPPRDLAVEIDLEVAHQHWPLPGIDDLDSLRDQLRERVVTLLAELTDPDADQNLNADERASVLRGVRHLEDPYARLLGIDRVERTVREEVIRLRGARTRAFIDVLALRHATEGLRALAQAEGRLAKPVPEVLFVCVQNAGRSQMAAAIADQLAQGRIHAWSAGSQPSASVHPEVVQVMNEVGVDLSTSVPKPWTNDLVRAADIVITMGCGDDCPYFPGVQYLDWEVPDPAGKPLKEIRQIRDDLTRRIHDLLASLTSDPTLADRPIASG
jgi:protein-tyrosine-phosphatase/DNA-binding transcriptional ArsR family regulator